MRSDAGKVRWTARDLAALEWIADQRAVAWEQLGELLGRLSGREPLKDKGTEAVVRRWQKADAVHARTLHGADSAGDESDFSSRWVWLTSEGLETLDLEGESQIPAPASLLKLWSVNALRLGLEAEAETEVTSVFEWASAAELGRRMPDSDYLPEAVATIAGDRTAIVFVESAAVADELPRITEELAQICDSVAWYTLPATRQPALSHIEAERKARAGLRHVVRRLDPYLPEGVIPEAVPTKAEAQAAAALAVPVSETETSSGADRRAPIAAVSAEPEAAEHESAHHFDPGYGLATGLGAASGALATRWVIRDGLKWRTGARVTALVITVSAIMWVWMRFVVRWLDERWRQEAVAAPGAAGRDAAESARGSGESAQGPDAAGIDAIAPLEPSDAS